VRILLVDDHAEVRQSLGEFLEQLGHRVDQAEDGRVALMTARSGPDLIISDLRMPGMGGLDLLQALEGLDDPPPLALMTAFGDTQTAIEAMRLGAVDYLRKPIDVKELHALVERIAADARPGRAAGATVEADGLVVTDPAIQRLVALADRLHAARDLPCLIEGETGVGKELFARRVHHGGKPDRSPFVAINCAAIAPGLFESEVFGYAAGAFTGAAPGGSPGKLAAAAGGTVFLDEIGDMPAEQQAKLLRLLEDRTWYPVGSSKLQKLDARVICATNARLLERVRSGGFREDLYYRLKVGHLRIPPLRERRESIVPLAGALLARVRRERGRGPQRLSTTAETFLAAQPWPGNARELRHLLEQACLMHDGAVLDEAQLRELMPDAIDAAPVLAPAAAVSPGALALPAGGFDLDAWQQRVIAEALALNEGSPVRTAAYLGITRKVLYTLRKRYGLLAPRDGQ
jgi:DNA-binding NtrC family response regulator